jgi:hypothetical protein
MITPTYIAIDKYMSKVFDKTEGITYGSKKDAAR